MPKFQKNQMHQQRVKLFIATFFFQVVTPKKINDVYLYDMPPSRCSPVTSSISRAHSPREQPGELDYDVPPRAIPVTDGAFRNCPRCSPQPPPSCVSPASRDVGEAYDVPRSMIRKYSSLCRKFSINI